MLNQLTIIYANDVETLQKYKDKATHWLPENSFNPTNTIYTPPNMICTTKYTALDLVRVLIQDETLSNKDVIWIDANNPTCLLCYTFDHNGYLNNFFKL